MDFTKRTRGALVTAMIGAGVCSVSRVEPILAVPLSDSECNANTESRLEGKIAYEEGLVLFDKGDYQGALSAFKRARAVCPTAKNTYNIAATLDELGRPVDALEMLDRMQLEYFELSPDIKSEVNQFRTELKEKVGEVYFTGDFPGAKIILDGKDAGTLPVVGPLRVATGPHSLRVTKEGYLPHEAGIDVHQGKPLGVVLALEKIAVRPSTRRGLESRIQLILGKGKGFGFGGVVSVRPTLYSKSAFNLRGRIGLPVFIQVGTNANATFKRQDTGGEISGTTNDTFLSYGALIGMDIGYARPGWTLGGSAGVLGGGVSVVRTGSFTEQNAGKVNSYLLDRGDRLPPVLGFVSCYVMPEAWFRLPKSSLWLGAGLLIVIPLKKPNFVLNDEYNLHFPQQTRGLSGGFNESVLDNVFVGVAPGIAF